MKPNTLYLRAGQRLVPLYVMCDTMTETGDDEMLIKVIPPLCLEPPLWKLQRAIRRRMVESI